MVLPARISMKRKKGNLMLMMLFRKKLLNLVYVLRAIVPCILKMILTIPQLILEMVKTAFELQGKIIF